METSSKEIRTKIKKIKGELSEAKIYYSRQLSPLKQKESWLKQMRFTAASLIMPQKQNDKLHEIQEKIHTIESERDEKIKKLEKELEEAKNEYRSNYDNYKEKEKKDKQKNIQNKVQDAKIFLDRNKLWLILLAVGLVIIVGVVIANSVKRRIEEGRTYYVNINDRFEFDCNARIEHSWIYCEERIINGTFSNYDTVEFAWAFDLTTNGDNFAKRIHDSVSSFLYQKNDFNIDNLKDGIDVSHSFSLENKVLNKAVANKTTIVHYNFSEADLDLISQQHDKWVAEEAEKAAKAEQEAAERAAKEQQETEERARKEAEAKAAKEEAERKAAEEAEKKAAEEAEKKATESGNNPDRIPEDEVSTGIVVCQRAAKNNYGLKIKTTEFARGYAGNEDFTWMYVFRGSTYNMITCQYNWKTGYAEIMYIDL